MNMNRREEYHRSQGRRKCEERKCQMLQKGLINDTLCPCDLTIRKLLILVKINLNGELGLKQNHRRSICKNE